MMKQKTKIMMKIANKSNENLPKTITKTANKGNNEKF